MWNSDILRPHTITQNEKSKSNLEIVSNSAIAPSLNQSLYTINSLSSEENAPSFLERRRKFKIMKDHLDLTPDDYIDPDYEIIDDRYNHAAFKNSREQDEAIYKQLLPTSRREFKLPTFAKVYATTIDLDDIYIDHTINTDEVPVATYIEKAPSAFAFPKMDPPQSYPPEIFIRLQETETCVLFELPSSTCDKKTPEGVAAEKDNIFYEYITEGKGKNRIVLNQETQTRQYITQSRSSLAPRPQKKNAAVSATTWDMHDTYAKLATEAKSEKPDEMVLYQSASSSQLRKSRRPVDKQKKSKSFEEIAALPEFLDTVLITERVLTSSDYAEAQRKFRGLVKVDPLSKDLVYIYSMKPLWTFECEETMNKPITNIAFNPKNPNILASCHGKFAYAQNCEGMVCIWCIKNPHKPERLYHFECPLTAVSFSERNTNWLACGFWNGDVIIIDITSYTVKTVAVSNRNTNPSFDPVWGVHWRAFEKYNEHVITICEDGRISKFTTTKTHDFLCAQMMRVSTVEGKLRGLQTTRPILKTNLPIVRFPGVLCMRWHPTVSHIYLVGTVEGCIHKCSTHYLNQHIDVFQAHAGPVYDIMICPFHKRLLASCGADNAIRLWMEGMDDVIITLMCSAAVYGVAFCPKNATIIMSVSGNVLSVWDIRRKTHKPCAEYSFPQNVTLTYIHFADSGDDVFVSDTLGRIHTFHLEDTPIPPYYQRVMLEEVLENALCTRPKMLKQLKKLNMLETNDLNKHVSC